jgi:hypothetical protein
MHWFTMHWFTMHWFTMHRFTTHRFTTQLGFPFAGGGAAVVDCSRKLVAQ